MIIIIIVMMMIIIIIVIIIIKIVVIVIIIKIITSSKLKSVTEDLTFSPGITVSPVPGFPSLSEPTR